MYFISVDAKYVEIFVVNSSKSEFIPIGTSQRLRTLPPVASPTIAGIPILFSETIKTLTESLKIYSIYGKVENSYLL